MQRLVRHLPDGRRRQQQRRPELDVGSWHRRRWRHGSTATSATAKAFLDRAYRFILDASYTSDPASASTGYTYFNATVGLLHRAHDERQLQQLLAPDRQRSSNSGQGSDADYVRAHRFVSGARARRLTSGIGAPPGLCGASTPAAGGTRRATPCSAGLSATSAHARARAGGEYSRAQPIDTTKPFMRAGFHAPCRYVYELESQRWYRGLGIFSLRTCGRQELSMFRWARFRWAVLAGSSRATRFWAFSPARGALVFAVAWLLAGCDAVLGIHKPVGTGEGSGGGIGSTVNPDAGGSDSSVVVDSGATQDGPASPCAAGMVRCNGLQPQTCNAAHWENTGMPCDTVCSSGACVGICAPNAKRCNGLQPQVWTDPGLADRGTSCPNVCSAGACVGTCTPNSTRCNLLQPQVCGSDGTWMDTGAPCSNVCSDGTCTGACAPNQTRCNGAQPETCDISGLWQKTGAASCFVCSAGTCSSTCSPKLRAVQRLAAANVHGCRRVAATPAPPARSSAAQDFAKRVRAAANDATGSNPSHVDTTGHWVDTGTACPFLCTAGACGGACSPAATQCNGLQPQKCSPHRTWANTIRMPLPLQRRHLYRSVQGSDEAMQWAAAANL